MALRDYLEEFIIDKLEVWQGAEGPDGIAYIAIDAIANPGTNPYASAVPNMNGRLNDVTDELAKELKKGNISSWVVPRYAALLFEGMFNACVAFWIARGKPTKGAKLEVRPDVRRFVQLQVRLFTALVGAK